MKTTNNVRKTNLKSVIIAAGLIVTGFSVEGQGATKTNFEGGHIHYAMVSVKEMANSTFNAGSKTTAVFTAFLAPAAEEALIVENWMTDSKRFNSIAALIEPATEDALTVEAWMTDEKTFETKSTLNSPVRKFMSNKITSTSKFVYREVNMEEELKVETWMLDPEVWQ